MVEKKGEAAGSSWCVKLAARALLEVGGGKQLARRLDGPLRDLSQHTAYLFFSGGGCTFGQQSPWHTAAITACTNSSNEQHHAHLLPLHHLANGFQQLCSVDGYVVPRSCPLRLHTWEVTGRHGGLQGGKQGETGTHLIWLRHSLPTSPVGFKWSRERCCTQRATRCRFIWQTHRPQQQP